MPHSRLCSHFFPVSSRWDLRASSKIPPSRTLPASPSNQPRSRPCPSPRNRPFVGGVGYGSLFDVCVRRSNGTRHHHSKAEAGRHKLRRACSRPGQPQRPEQRRCGSASMRGWLPANGSVEWIQGGGRGGRGYKRSAWIGLDTSSLRVEWSCRSGPFARQRLGGVIISSLWISPAAAPPWAAASVRPT